MAGCLHGMPPAVCAICTKTLRGAPGDVIHRADKRDKRTFGGYRSTNFRMTTFQITRRIDPSTVDHSESPVLVKAAKAAIQERFGKLKTPPKPKAKPVNWLMGAEALKEPRK